MNIRHLIATIVLGTLIFASSGCSTLPPVTDEFTEQAVIGSESTSEIITDNRNESTNPESDSAQSATYLQVPTEWINYTLENYLSYDKYVEGSISTARDCFVTLPNHNGTPITVYIPPQDDFVWGLGMDVYSFYEYDFDHMRLYYNEQQTVDGHPVVTTLVTSHRQEDFNKKVFEINQIVQSARKNKTLVYENPLQAIVDLLNQQKRITANVKTSPIGTPYYEWFDAATGQYIRYFFDRISSEWRGDPYFYVYETNAYSPNIEEDQRYDKIWLVTITGNWKPLT